MTRTTRVAAVVMAMTLAACGTSGSNPPQLSEVHFTVQALGFPAQFTVPNLNAGGIRLRSLENLQFVFLSRVDFVIENAAPNYGGTFMRTGDFGNEIKVSLNFISTTGATPQPTTEDQTSPLRSTVSVSSPDSSPMTPGSALPSASPEIRIDVCQPSNGGSCLVIGDPQVPIDVGTALTSFTGSIGDGTATRLIGGPGGNSFATTPAIFFFVNARNNVNAVLRSTEGQTLIVRLYVDGALRATSSGTEDVIIREDI